MTKTPNLNLNVPDYRDLRWDIPVNENWSLLDTVIAGKQAILTFDTTPTLGSANPVTSGGIYNALLNIDVLPSQVGQAGKFLTTDGTNTIWAQVDITPDNLSITKDSNNRLQTVGVINSRDSSTAIKTWTGTKAQYEAIVSKNANTLYNITDDTDVSLTILEALYPVGSIYITTSNTCPLSTLISGSTWALVSSGRVLQGASSGHAAGTTIEAGLPNITGELVNSSTYRSYLDLTGSGALDVTRKKLTNLAGGSGTNSDTDTITFDASRSSSIYGKSTTVQPPAYVVNIYRRTA